ncbi:hypothetical protein NOCA2150142 [metagenome]|uniref:Uncharacterized protein n=1 Tax=metagenome TaxID=256318 RepID=A0A2P2BXC4_9ZZZZ
MSEQRNLTSQPSADPAAPESGAEEQPTPPGGGSGPSGESPQQPGSDQPESPEGGPTPPDGEPVDQPTLPGGSGPTDEAPEQPSPQEPSPQEPTPTPGQPDDDGGYTPDVDPANGPNLGGSEGGVAGDPLTRGGVTELQDLDGDGFVDTVIEVALDGSVLVVVDTDGDSLADTALADLDGDGTFDISVVDLGDTYYVEVDVDGDGIPESAELTAEELADLGGGAVIDGLDLVFDDNPEVVEAPGPDEDSFGEW